MLVLSRKVGERILIGDHIAVTIVRVTGGGVRVGIEAPAEMAVLRAEIQPAAEADSEPPEPATRLASQPPASGESAAKAASASVTTITNNSDEQSPAPETPPVRKPR